MKLIKINKDAIFYPIKNHKIYINPLDKAGLIVYINTCNTKTKRNKHACISKMVIYPEVRPS